MMVRWLRWHCPPDTGFEIRALAVWGRARYLSVTEAPHNTNFHTWMGKKHFIVSFKPPRPGTEPRTLAWKAAVLTTTLGPPPACYCTTSMLEKQSIQLYPETMTTIMEQQERYRADGTWERSTGKNEKYSDPRPFHTRFGNWHIWVADTAQLCIDTARWRTYTVDSVRRRDIPWNSVSKRDISSNDVQKPYIAYRDRRQRD